MKKIAAIGANVIDTIVTLDCFPAEDTKMQANGFKKVGGGPAATGLIAAAKLGEKDFCCSFIGNYANDGDGDYLLADFEKYAVDTTFMTGFDNCRSFSSQIWLSEQNFTRTCVFDKGNLPPLSLDERQIDCIQCCDLLMVDGNEMSAAVSAAKLAKGRGKHVLYDAGGLYDGVDKLIGFADILIPSKEFACGFTGENDVKAAAKKLYEQYNPSVVVITCGKDGGICFDENGCRDYPAYPASVVDSNGAGDVFHGAFAAGIMFGFDYYTCCHFASATSALKCEKIGAREAVPTKKEVLNHLKENGFTI